MPRVIKSLNVKETDAFCFENIKESKTIQNTGVLEEVFDEETLENSKDYSFDNDKYLEEIENIKKNALIEAEKIIKEAKMKAEDIVDYAKNQADDLKVKSKEEGYNEGFLKAKDEGYKQGYDEGYEKAVDKATKDAFLKYDELLYELKTIIDAVSLDKTQFIAKNRDSLTRLALTVAEKVIDVSLSSSSEVIERMILRGLEESTNNEKVKIYISDFQAELITKCDTDMLKRIEEISSNVKIEVLKDAHIGTCVVELSDKIVDTSSKTMLKNIEEAIYE